MIDIKALKFLFEVLQTIIYKTECHVMLKYLCITRLNGLPCARIYFSNILQTKNGAVYYSNPNFVYLMLIVFIN